MGYTPLKPGSFFGIHLDGAMARRLATSLRPKPVSHDVPFSTMAPSITWPGAPLVTPNASLLWSPQQPTLVTRPPNGVPIEPFYNLYLPATWIVPEWDGKRPLTMDECEIGRRRLLALHLFYGLASRPILRAYCRAHNGARALRDNIPLLAEEATHRALITPTRYARYLQRILEHSPWQASAWSWIFAALATPSLSALLKTDLLKIVQADPEMVAPVYRPRMRSALYPLSYLGYRLVSNVPFGMPLNAEQQQFLAVQLSEIRMHFPPLFPPQE